MKKIAVLLFVLLLLPVYALANDKNPHFHGEITPITTPTSFSYGSSEYDLDMETLIIEGEETMGLSVPMHIKTLKLPVGISWNIKIDTMSFDGEPLPMERPLMILKLLTSFKGELVSVDIQTEIATMDRKTKFDYVKSMKDMSAVLNNGGIVTGDILFESPLNTGTMGTGAGETLEMVLDGYGTWEGRKVVVASGSVDKQKMMIEEDMQAIITYFGYTLFDAENMAILKSEAYMGMQLGEYTEQIEFFMKSSSR